MTVSSSAAVITTSIITTTAASASSTTTSQTSQSSLCSVTLFADFKLTQVVYIRPTNFTKPWQNRQPKTIYPDKQQPSPFSTSSQTHYNLMPLTAAEKQRRYRERRDKDPAKRAKYLEQQKERYEQDKATGKRKLVGSMTPREKRKQRRYWREKQKDSRQKRKQQSNIITPPGTPEHDLQPGPSRQLSQTKKWKAKQTSKHNREKNVLQLKLKQAQKRAEMYRKRWERLKDLQKSDTPDTPRTKTKKLLRCYSSKVIRKTLDFHHVLLAQLRDNCRQRIKKRAFDRLVTGSIVRKYRLSGFVRKEVGTYQKTSRVQKRGYLSTKLQIQVRNFFERDDISRTTTGKKQTVTKGKIKKQKRILNDTVDNVYKKFIAETNKKVSYTTFWRLKPFWIKSPTHLDRDTCVCKTCDNLQMMANSLYRANVIETPDISKIVGQIVCSINDQSCMYGLCDECNDKKIKMQECDKAQLIQWQEWKTIKEERTIKRDRESKVKAVSITKKMKKQGTTGELLDKFEESLTKYKQHQFNMFNQYNYYRQTKNNLDDRECFVHIDFSENYVGKLARETSSMHYGASQNQITMHTGFYQVGSSSGSVSFATVSDSLNHGPPAIWAHLTPVLLEIRTKYPTVEHVHFFSDGPSTQYRQKNNFYLLSTEIFALGFKGASWNFHEAGHGKGIPDGIGASLKRAADRRVLYGADITNAEDLMVELEKSETKIALFHIGEEAIKPFEDKLDGKIRTVPGTLRIHQIIVPSYGEICYRDVSCHCRDTVCNLHVLKHFKLADRPEACVSQEQNVQNADDLFSYYMEILSQCKTLHDIQNVCRSFSLEPVAGKPRSVLVDTLAVDYVAMDLYPDDYKSDHVPVSVRADGDCLPACGSLYLYGNDLHSDEVRVRIIAELALNMDYYLEEDNLRKGVSQFGQEADCSLKKKFAMFSPDFIPGIALTDDIIRAILENEIKCACTPKSNMGILQIFALATVLQMPIFAIYPNLGEMLYRSYLHRLIIPRLSSTNTSTVAIMWTSTRDDMTPANWKPNHFVPVVPIDTLEGDAHEREEVTIEVFFVENCETQGEETGVQDLEEHDAHDRNQMPKETECETDKDNGETLEKDCAEPNLEKPSEQGRNQIPLNATECEIDKDNGETLEKDSEEPDKGKQSEQGRNQIPMIETECEIDKDNDETLEKDSEEPVSDKQGEQGRNKIPMKDAECEIDKDNGETLEKESEEPVSDKQGEQGINQIHMEDAECETDKDNGETLEKDSEEPVSDKQGEQGRNKIPMKDTECEIEIQMDNLLGKHVVVSYDDTAYPGIVADVSKNEVYVECMKRGKKANTFYWPKKQKDFCWYTSSDILAVVPAPLPSQGTKACFEFEPSVWKNAVRKLNKE